MTDLEEFILAKTGIIETLARDIRSIYDEDEDFKTISTLVDCCETALDELKTRLINEGLMKKVDVEYRINTNAKLYAGHQVAIKRGLIEPFGCIQTIKDGKAMVYWITHGPHTAHKWIDLDNLVKIDERTGWR